MTALHVKMKHGVKTCYRRCKTGHLWIFYNFSEYYGIS